jgi:hypothetical protein
MSNQRRWRAWLNHHVLDRWLTGGRYYQLNFVSGDHARSTMNRTKQRLRLAFLRAPLLFPLRFKGVFAMVRVSRAVAIHESGRSCHRKSARVI